MDNFSSSAIRNGAESTLLKVKKLKMDTAARDGHAFVTGSNGTKDFKKAVELLTIAMNMGYRNNAYMTLGVLYTRGGFGLEMDLTKGKEFLEKAINSGDNTTMAKKYLKLNIKLSKKKPEACQKIINKAFK